MLKCKPVFYRFWQAPSHPKSCFFDVLKFLEASWHAESILETLFSMKNRRNRHEEICLSKFFVWGSQVSGRLLAIQIHGFWCPEALGSFLESSWIVPEFTFFLWKIDVTDMKKIYWVILLRTLWGAHGWGHRWGAQGFKRFFKVYTKLKKHLSAMSKIRWFFSMCGNYSLSLSALRVNNDAQKTHIIFYWV